MRIAILLGVALTITACDEDDGDPTQYVAVDDIAKAYQTAYCSYAVRCGMFPDPGSCTAAALITSAVAFAPTPDEVAAIHAGRVSYQGSNLKKCFDALAAQTCDKTDKDGRAVASLIACLDITRGTVAGGGTCIIDAECISQNCAGGSTTACTMGVCVGDTAPSYEPAALGQPCSPYCADGLWCDFNTDTCQTLKPAGAACMQNTECDYGLMCLTDTGLTTRSCKAAPTLNQPCPDFMCRDEGQYCSSTTTTCLPVGLPPTTCTSSAACSPYYPCDFTTSQCKKGPTVGMTCSSAARCFDLGTFCDSLTTTCVALRTDGSQCQLDTECKSGSCDTNLVPAICATPTTCF